MTGKIVAYANKKNKNLDQLSLEELQKFNKKNIDAKNTFSIEESVKIKKVLAEHHHKGLNNQLNML